MYFLGGTLSKTLLAWRLLVPSLLSIVWVSITDSSCCVAFQCHWTQTQNSGFKIIFFFSVGWQHLSETSGFTYVLKFGI